jgi:hypothetical protein
MNPTPSVMTLPRELRPYLDLLNQVFEIDKKASALTESNSIARNIRNMRGWFERDIVGPGGQPVYSLTFHNPMGESYNETRADCDASIAGSGTEQLVITEVMKPIVWLSIGGGPKYIVQQAVVVVESSRPSIASQSAEQELTDSVVVGETYSFDGQVLPKTPDNSVGLGRATDTPSTNTASETDSTQTPA